MVGLLMYFDHNGVFHMVRQMSLEREAQKAFSHSASRSDWKTRENVVGCLFIPAQVAGVLVRRLGVRPSPRIFTTLENPFHPSIFKTKNVGPIFP